MRGQILVTGGAGYIGSHVVKKLRETGYDVVIYDNLCSGSVSAVLNGNLVIGNLGNKKLLRRTFAEHHFDAVLHFAANISVPESIENPLEYYANNTGNTLNLLQCCKLYGVKKLIFSSTAAVYGETTENPIGEYITPKPVNPYGRSKLMSEQIIQDYSYISNLKYIILRYFNVAGADPTGQIGQSTKKASHLIKVACDAALGRRSSVGIFGTDFPTPDGTGIRDYIHVEDLAQAHIDALHYLEADGNSQILNCGYGQGYSVREVIEKVKEISGVDFAVIEEKRREGDPACVIARSEKIKQLFGWKPQYNNLHTMISTALAWEKKLIALAAVEESLAAQDFKLGALLVHKKMISNNQLEIILAEQLNSGKKLGEMLVEQNLITPVTLHQVLMEQKWHKQGVWLNKPSIPNQQLTPIGI